MRSKFPGGIGIHHAVHIARTRAFGLTAWWSDQVPVFDDRGDPTF
jgi:hypothetical protein